MDTMLSSKSFLIGAGAQEAGTLGLEIADVAGSVEDVSSRMAKKTEIFAGLRARFESVRALRSPLHTPPVRYFCHCRTHKLCCKCASMHVELALSSYLHWRYPACQGRCTCPSGDLSKRALMNSLLKPV